MYCLTVMEMHIIEQKTDFSYINGYKNQPSISLSLTSLYFPLSLFFLPCLPSSLPLSFFSFLPKDSRLDHV